jgi:hypothetical protein
MYNSDNKICDKSMDASNSETPKQQQGTSGMPLKSWIQATARKQFDHSKDRKKSTTVWPWSTVTAGIVATAGAPVISGTPARASRDITKSRKASNWMDTANSRKVKKHGIQQKKRHKQLQKQ